MNRLKQHFINFDITGFAHWDGCEIFNDLNIGTLLTLVREENNQFDSYSVALYYGNSKLGYIPTDDNQHISKLLEMGHADIFETRINRITPEVHPENQIGVTVFVKRKAEIK